MLISVWQEDSKEDVCRGGRTSRYAWNGPDRKGYRDIPQYQVNVSIPDEEPQPHRPKSRKSGEYVYVEFSKSDDSRGYPSNQSLGEFSITREAARHLALALLLISESDSIGKAQSFAYDEGTCEARPDLLANKVDMTIDQVLTFLKRDPIARDQKK